LIAVEMRDIRYVNVRFILSMPTHSLPD